MPIEADHYRETRAALARDPIIRQMARELPDDWRLRFHGPNDRTMSYHFMTQALDEYKRRGGTISTHIGGPAEAIFQVRKEMGYDPDETQEGLERLDLRDALEQIAYPSNWPPAPRSLVGWMQSVAANALSNAGTYNYERKAKP